MSEGVGNKRGVGASKKSDHKRERVGTLRFPLGPEIRIEKNELKGGKSGVYLYRQGHGGELYARAEGETQKTTTKGKIEF